MNKKDNCFTLIKYIVALSVVYQHARLNGLCLPDIAIINWIDKVPIFFFISGYTIIMSLTYKEQSFKSYCFRRFSRLYPELWLSIMLEIILFVSQFPYLLGEIKFYLWIFARSTFFQFWTPDILRFYGGGTPNGSLWTIIISVQFYLIIYFIYKKIDQLNYKQDVFVLLLCILANSFISILDDVINGTVYLLLLETIVPYMYMFYFGIMFYKWSDQLIPFCKKNYWIIVIVFIIGSLGNWLTNFIPHTSNTGTVIHVLLSCLLAFATAYKFSFVKIEKDYSYGIYIYHMIVMNFFIHNQVIKNVYLELAVIYVVVFMLAVLSNLIAKKWIEKIKQEYIHLLSN